MNAPSAEPSKAPTIALAMLAVVYAFNFIDRQILVALEVD